jgi:drug/metabolite transporter (DMT)-like permease
MLLELTVMRGSAFMMIKVAVNHLPPFTVVAGRMVFGAVTLVGLPLIQMRRLPHGGRSWLFFFSIAAVVNTAALLLVSWGQRYIDSGLAGIQMACMPLFTLILAHFCLLDERVTSMRVASFAVGFCGVVVLIGADFLMYPGEHAGQPVPMLAVLGAACYAVATLQEAGAMRRTDGSPPSWTGPERRSKS